jgi:hypothetical protein
MCLVSLNNINSFVIESRYLDDVSYKRFHLQDDNPDIALAASTVINRHILRNRVLGRARLMQR